MPGKAHPAMVSSFSYTATGLSLAALIWYVSTSFLLSHCGDGSLPVGAGAGAPAAVVGEVPLAVFPRPHALVAPPRMAVPAALATLPSVRTQAAKVLRMLEEGKAEGAAFEAAASELAVALLGGEAEARRAAAGEGAAAAPPAAPARRKPRAAKVAGAAAAGGGSGSGGPLPPLPEFTQQTCYLQADESEQCVYEGPLCFDGKSPVVVVDRPIREPERILDYTHSCSDFRYYETSALEISGCGYGYSSFRPYNASLPVRPGTDYPLPLTRRRWGAQNRNGHLYFKELPPEEIFGPRAPAGEARSGAAAHRYAKLLREASYGGGPGVNVSWAAQAAAARSGGGGLHWSPGGAYASVLLREGPFTHEAVPGMRIARRTRVGNRTIDWLEGALWLAGIDGQWWQNPYHWWTKMGALFDAQRANASHPAGWGGHPDDGFLHASYGAGPHGGGLGEGAPSGGAAIRRTPTWNRASWRVGPQWRLPPQDNVLFTGDGSINLQTRVPLLYNVTSLNPWFRATLTLATQPAARLLFSDLISSLGDGHLVCTLAGGAVPGTKHKLFTSRADAWLLRQYAYEVVAAVPPEPRPPSPTRRPEGGAKPSLTRTPAPAPQRALVAAAAELRRATLATSHPRHVPRKVTIIGRKGQNGRGIYNIDRVLALLNASGLPVEIISTMATLSFEEQVELMAGTGLLIAPHGAHLQNIMFLPAHAAVIELWPFLMKKSTYRMLATQLDLHYFPCYSWDLLPMTLPNTKAFYGVELMNQSYYYNKCVRLNISSYESLTEHACNTMSKNYPIIVPFPAFHHVLRDALDAIGAFSLTNEDWRAELLASGEEGPPVPIKPPPPSLEVEKPHEHFAAQRQSHEGDDGEPWEDAVGD